MIDTQFFMMKIVRKHDQEVEGEFFPKHVGQISISNNLKWND